ncbi:glutenin, high molecular weight subunit PW212-like [Chrysoperla carnea]|uniref:glutenin, high molecular weight subunit PW212-like n=1 Tax=Chrysoperla carnea TaxID=189513 RepID=UPI001D07E6BD|nr:glutenin, high molecular weight subunit PW212-like [Chrysoperla carnea]
MNKFIVFTVVLVAIWGAGAEPPQFRTFKYVHPAQPATQPQFGQQQAVASGTGYDPAGPPAGQLLLLPGEYVVQVNQPLRQYGAPEQAQFVPQPAAVEQYNYQQQQFAGAQDPNYYNNGQQYQGQQFGQYNGQQGQYNAPGQQTSQAAVQFGQYNAQQGQYNAPSQQSGQYNEQQNGQYNAQSQQPQFGQRVAPKQSPAPFGQLKVQKGKFSGQLNVGEQTEADVDEQQDDAQEAEPQVPAAKAQRGNVKYNKQVKQPEQVDAQYQQGRYVQRGSARFTSPKSQVELVKTNGNQQQAEEAARNAQNDDDDDEEADENQEFSGRYTQSNTQSKSGKYTAPAQQEQSQYVPSRTFFFGRYTQPSDAQQAEVQSDYSKVNKYVPPKARGKTTTETPESSTTEVSSDSTTEVGPTVAYDAEAKENYTNDKEAEEESTKAANGYYYLLLPDGKLQKIVYMTEEDLKKMAFVARLQYQNVEPIQGPVYSYNPENSPFVQVF